MPPQTPDTPPDPDPDPPPDHAQPLLLPLPGLLWLVLLALGAVELAFWAGAQGLVGGATAPGWRLLAVERFGFAAPVQHWMIGSRQAPPEHLLRYLSYPLVHAGPAQAALSAVLLAALGKFTARRHGQGALAALLLLPGALGAAAFGALTDGSGWLLGATPAVLALVGAWTLARWRDAASPRARFTALGLIGSFLLARLALGLLVETAATWIADLTAFAAGVILAAALRPGALRRTLARLRQR